MANKQVPYLADLFDWDGDEVKIRSAKCNSCGTYFFPEYHQQHRPGCSRENIEKVLLPNKGTLASYCIQHYMCPPPFKTMGNITPYGIVQVDFPEGIQVVGLMVEGDLDKLELGQEMETTTYTLFHDDEGNDVVTWAFRPVQ